MKNRNRILNAFTAWYFSPGPRIDLIRTTHGQPIYFSGIEHGHQVSMIDYQFVNLQTSKA